MERGSYRKELKFICAERDLVLLENKLCHICKPDTHAGPKGIYAVRSLYFDTFSDSCYLENQAGVDDRKKYRVRIYDESTDVIKLECKYSKHGMKAKEACNITRQQCESLMKGSTVTDVSDTQELLKRFLIERKMNLLMPKVIVEYNRTPYVYPAGNVRITFDRQIHSSPDILRFLEKRITCRTILPEDVHILEIKYDDMLPGAILELVVSGGKLSKTSFSKYALCREYNIG